MCSEASLERRFDKHDPDVLISALFAGVFVEEQSIQRT